MRTLLLPHLPSILSRLQDHTDSPNVSTLSGPSEKTGSAGGREEGKQDKGKRKRSDSMDNNNNTSTYPPAVVATSSSSNGGAKKFNKNSASKVLQEQVTRGMCREALIKALGKMRYILVVLFSVFFACCVVDAIAAIFLSYVFSRKDFLPSFTFCTTLNMLIAFQSLGKYIAYSVKLPDLGQKHKRGNSGLVLGDLEEALVPYYASASKQDYYCRLWI